MKTEKYTDNGLKQEVTAEQFKAFEADLQAAAAKWFANHGHPVLKGMDYCVSEPSLWHHNIILPEVVQMITRTAQAWKIRNPTLKGCLSDSMHHGLSSQAMKFNLLGPLVARKDLSPLKAAFEAVGGRWPGCDLKPYFEHYDRQIFNERHGIPTCFDFALIGQGTGLFIETKLSEPGFDGCPHHQDGSCDGKNPCSFARITECPLTQSGYTYWQRMDECQLIEAALVDGDTCPFVSYYEFFQKLMFAVANQGVFILLYDERSPIFVQRDAQGNLTGGICKHLSDALPRHIWTRVGGITVQGLVRAIEASGRHGDWIQEFKDKYGIN
ncbi:MAG: hypothetical protein WCJ02_04910 [bacterium]